MSLEYFFLLQQCKDMLEIKYSFFLTLLGNLYLERQWVWRQRQKFSSSGVAWSPAGTCWPYFPHDRIQSNTQSASKWKTHRSVCCHRNNWALISFFFSLCTLKQNPFGTAGSLRQEERQRAGNQSVCSLQDFLQLAGQAQKMVIFDLYRPPYGHPYSNSWIQRTLDVLYNVSSIQSSQVKLIQGYLMFNSFKCFP